MTPGSVARSAGRHGWSWRTGWPARWTSTAPTAPTTGLRPDVQVPFNDLGPGTRAMRAELEAAIGAVLDSGWYILGKQGEAFEREFAAWLGVDHGIGVGSG